MTAIIKKQEVLLNFLDSGVDPKHIALFRILYALITFTVVATTFRFFDFKFYGESGFSYNFFIILNCLWFISVLMILVGRVVSLSALYCFIVTPLLFDTTLGGQLIRIGAFWMIFMKAGSSLALAKESTNERCPAWPVYLMAINILIVDFFSGAAKLFDPFWVNGFGFYYSFLEPWLRDGFFSVWLLESKSAMLLLNYLTIVIQIAGLPLFFFKTTRNHAILATVGQFVFLIFPIRIDPIGPIGLVICFCMYSLVPNSRETIWLNTWVINPIVNSLNSLSLNIVKKKDHRLNLFPDRYSSFLSLIVNRSVRGLKKYQKYWKCIPILLLVLMILSSAYSLAIGLKNTYVRYPVIPSPLRVQNKVDLDQLRGSGWAIKYADVINYSLGLFQQTNFSEFILSLPFIRTIYNFNERTFGIGWWAPFTMKHFIC